MPRGEDEVKPIEVVVSLWIHAGRVAEFEAYERQAARIMQRYGGVVQKVVRVSDADAATRGSHSRCTSCASLRWKRFVPIAQIVASCERGRWSRLSAAASVTITSAAGANGTARTGGGGG